MPRPPMSKSERRKANKKKALKICGNKCYVCEYDACEAALEFHHKNKKRKRFSISNGLHLPWHILKSELNKCVLLCRNCHSELHEGMIEL
jgi:predicted HNH restriction endonuclease